MKSLGPWDSFELGNGQICKALNYMAWGGIAEKKKKSKIVYLPFACQTVFSTVIS